MSFSFSGFEHKASINLKEKKAKEKEWLISSYAFDSTAQKRGWRRAPGWGSNDLPF